MEAGRNCNRSPSIIILKYPIEAMARWILLEESKANVAPQQKYSLIRQVTKGTILPANS
jgi:hypothetical protein